MRGARRPASRKSAQPTWTRRKGASGTCWRSSRIQETLGGRSSIETTLAVLRFRNRLVIEAWLGARLRQRRPSPLEKGRTASTAERTRASIRLRGDGSSFHLFLFGGRVARNPGPREGTAHQPSLRDA